MPEERLRGRERALPPAADLPHQRRGLRVLHLGRNRAFLAGLDPRQRGTYARPLLVFQESRIGQLADRLHGRAAAVVRAHPEDSRHEPDLPASDFAVGGSGSAGGRAGILPQPNGGDGCGTASGPCGIERGGRRVQRTGGVRGLLRPAERRGPHRIDAACGTPGAGTPRGGDARLDVRCCRSLCAAGVLRPARSRHGPRGHRAARLRSARS